MPTDSPKVKVHMRYAGKQGTEAPAGLLDSAGKIGTLLVEAMPEGATFAFIVWPPGAGVAALSPMEPEALREKLREYIGASGGAYTRELVRLVHRVLDVGDDETEAVKRLAALAVHVGYQPPAGSA